jgi:hypothetical protein
MSADRDWLDHALYAPRRGALREIFWFCDRTILDYSMPGREAARLSCVPEPQGADMPIDTTLTTRLGITRPILSAPMAPIAGARLVAAVSEAGGFGILGRGSGDRPATFTGRALVNDHARRWMGREVELIQNVDAVAAVYAAARVAGNFDIAGVFAGEGVGLIHDIPKASEIVERITLEAEQVLEGRRNSATVPQAAVARRPQQQASKRTSCGRIAE